MQSWMTSLGSSPLHMALELEAMWTALAAREISSRLYEQWKVVATSTYVTELLDEEMHELDQQREVHKLDMKDAITYLMLIDRVYERLIHERKPGAVWQETPAPGETL